MARRCSLPVISSCPVASETKYLLCMSPHYQRKPDQKIVTGQYTYAMDHGKAQGGIAHQRTSDPITQRRRGPPPFPKNSLRKATGDGQSSRPKFTRNKQVPPIPKKHRRYRAARNATWEKPSLISDPISPASRIQLCARPAAWLNILWERLPRRSARH